MSYIFSNIFIWGQILIFPWPSFWLSYISRHNQVFWFHRNIVLSKLWKPNLWHAYISAQVRRTAKKVSMWKSTLWERPFRNKHSPPYCGPRSPSGNGRWCCLTLSSPLTFYYRWNYHAILNAFLQHVLGKFHTGTCYITSFYNY